MPRRSRRRSSKRRKPRRTKKKNKRRRRITRKVKRVRRRKRKRVQKGGKWVNKCINPFQGKYVPYEPVGDLRRGILTRQLAPTRPLKGGGNLWRNLGLKFPQDLYHDSKDFLMNVKNSYVGDRQDSTSNVMKQPIVSATLKPGAPSNYTKAFIEADQRVASHMQNMSE